MAISIAAVPPQLVAAQIFGHEKGAFTDAARERNGYFQQADGGTLFLDEIGLAPPDVQAALLRVLETSEVGSRFRRFARHSQSAPQSDLARESPKDPCRFDFRGAARKPTGARSRTGVEAGS